MPDRETVVSPSAASRTAVRRAPGTRDLALFAAVAGAYALGSEVAFSWFGADGLAASFFPSAGVTVAALLLLDRGRWPVVAAAAATAEVLVDLTHEIGLAAALGYAVANVSQALAGAALVRLWVRRPDLGRLHDLGAYLAGAVVLGPMLGGALGATNGVLLDDGDHWLRFAVEWWVGDGLGVLVVGSAILSLRRRRETPMPARAIVEAVAAAVACVLATGVAFWLSWPPLVFVVVGLLLLLGLRLGTRTVALTGCAVAFVAAEASSDGRGIWRSLDVSPATGIAYVQAITGAVIAVALALSAQIEERERTAAERAEAEAGRRLADRAARRAERLRSLAEALSRAVTVREVGEAFLHEALDKVGASAGTLMLLEAEGTQLRTVALAGAVPDGWHAPVPCDEAFLVPAAVLSEHVVVARSRQELEQRFPGSASRLRPGARSALAVPLRAFGSVIGAFGLELERELVDGEIDVSVLETMASVCGPALERARSFDAEAAAHVALRASERRFRGTFENAPVGIAEADTRGRYLRVNPRLCAITGYTEEELLALTYQEITHPDDVAADVALSREVIAGARGSYTLVKRYLRKDGDAVWVELEVSAARDEDGGIMHLIAVVEDITARMAAETALRQSEARFRALFVAIDEGYCLAEMVLDGRGEPVDYRFLEVNPLFEAMTGLRDAVGRTALELVPDLERTWVETYARVALGGEQLRFEERSEAMGRWFDVFATPVEPRGRFALVFKDVSLRRAAEQALQESEARERRSRRRAELLADVTGELERVEGFADRSRRLVELLVPRLADVATLRMPGDPDPIVARAPLAATDAAVAPEPVERAAVAVPVGDEHGSLEVALLDPARERLDEEDVRFVRELANRAGALLASARVREAEHLVAVSLQRALLPDDVLRHAALSVGARYEAGADVLEVGGDWYDSFELPDGTIGVVVGDVVGHGLEAAAAMGRYRTALAALARHSDCPSRLLDRMEAFAAGPDGCDFATCCYGTLDPASGRFRYASAGHPPILLVPARGEPRFLDDAQSLPLCGLRGEPRPESSVVLEPGDLLVLYSDGLVERRREQLSAGLERLAAIATELRDAPVDHVCDELVERMRRASAGDDDAVALCLRYTPTTATAFRWVLPARPEALGGLRAALRTWFGLAGIPPARGDEILLLVGEAAANAVEHAYGDGGRGVVDVEARLDGGTVELVVRDHGCWRPGTLGGELRGRGTGIMHALAETVERQTGRRGTTVEARLAAGPAGSANGAGAPGAVTRTEALPPVGR